MLGPSKQRIKPVDVEILFHACAPVLHAWLTVRGRAQYRSQSQACQPQVYSQAAA